MRESQDIRTFEEWLANKGGSLNKDIVVTSTPDRGLSVFALEPIPESTILSTVPKAALLSVRNGSMADVLEHEKIGGGPGLIAAVLHEQQKGTASEWWGYLQSFPSRVYVPAFWSPEELKWLQGTSLVDRLAADRLDLQDDFDSIIKPLAKAHPDLLDPAKTTFEAFCKAATFVSSRAFGVDDYHGMSLVPVADIFNHKAAVVELSSDYAIEPVCFGDGDDSSDSEGGGTNSQSPAADNDGSGAEEANSGSRDASSNPGSPAEASDNQESDSEEGRANDRASPAAPC
ncbi:hypothetical protein WJX84_003506 [Apatococcus fuscideae]|uniref:SET domain-containing protein n=1 Tax=Apatococcus fuscideae TaxID=2026836 RepID=A0AAW1SNJ6_9CHLO